MFSILHIIIHSILLLLLFIIIIKRSVCSKYTWNRGFNRKPTAIRKCNYVSAFGIRSRTVKIGQGRLLCRSLCCWPLHTTAADDAAKPLGFFVVFIWFFFFFVFFSPLYTYNILLSSPRRRLSRPRFCYYRGKCRFGGPKTACVACTQLIGGYTVREVTPWWSHRPAIARNETTAIVTIYEKKNINYYYRVYIYGFRRQRYFLYGSTIVQNDTINYIVSRLN